MQKRNSMVFIRCKYYWIFGNSKVPWLSWLKRLPSKQEITSSNLVGTYYRHFPLYLRKPAQFFSYYVRNSISRKQTIQMQICFLQYTKQLFDHSLRLWLFLIITVICICLPKLVISHLALCKTISSSMVLITDRYYG